MDELVELVTLIISPIAVLGSTIGLLRLLHRKRGGLRLFAICGIALILIALTKPSFWFLFELLLFNLVILLCLIGAVLGLVRALEGKPEGAKLLAVSVAIPILLGLLFPLFNLHFGGE